MIKRMCYYVSDTTRDKKTNEITPVMIKEDTKGYFLTDMKWGTDLEKAEERAAEVNKQLGLSEDDVTRLIGNSMQK